MKPFLLNIPFHYKAKILKQVLLITFISFILNETYQSISLYFLKVSDMKKFITISKHFTPKLVYHLWHQLLFKKVLKLLFKKIATIVSLSASTLAN
ncbi:hypothetical protein A6J77_004645 [Aerococcus viridans]|uniref:Cytochrome b/b6 C-terminal region profile domain-containing protein n=1 Tax=Aerococcus viridans TaxID=1377 RepID=A0A2J9PMN4_9LACT|nr:hypothetical protein A6J77_004645 [Aerococcus viridans]